MSKMSDAGKDHCNTVFIASLDYLFISDRAAGLDNGGNAGFVSSFNTVAEGEEGVRG